MNTDHMTMDLNSTLGSALAAAGLVLALAGPLQGQVTPEQPFSLNVRGGVNVPTFDVADLADPGPSIGVGLKYALSDRVFLRANGDVGFHPGAELETTGGAMELPDTDIYHYVAGIGYRLTPSESPFYASVNVGAGAMTFDRDPMTTGGEGASNTFFAINAGGELGYRVSENVSLFFSPQGDIAFVEEQDLDPTGGDVFPGDEEINSAWVWPFTAGVEITP